MLQDVLAKDTLEELLRGLTSQLAEREDVILCSDVRNKLFGPLEFSRRDLGESKLPSNFPLPISGHCTADLNHYAVS